MKLKDIGWNPESSEEKINTDSLARIFSVHRGLCKAITTSGNVNIHLSGRYHADIASGADKPTTGDFIKINSPFIDEQNSKAAMLEEILPRRSKISRIASGHSVEEQVLVANVDFAFIVTSADDDFSINRLERYVLLAKQGHVTPIIVLSKIDLIGDPQILISEIKERIDDVEVFSISCVLDVGLEKLQKKLTAGSTGVFLGSSGVGKSTIVNRLLGEQVQLTKEVRAEDSKGYHTTTTRELFFIPSGGMIIDTPGLREVQVLASEETVASTFKEISKLALECKFSNCAHDKEPGCAINKALETGDLDQEEYNNYLKLQREAAFAEKKMSKSKKTNAKERWKTINKNYKARKKFEDQD